RSWRPVPTRSVARTILVHLISHLVNVMDKTGPLSREPSFRELEGNDGVWVDPTPQLIVGELGTWASVASVEPIRIPGYFFGTRNESYVNSSQKVVYSLHGGSYTQCSAHPSGINSTIVQALLRKTDSNITTVFAIEYRLSTANPLEPTNPFPTALIDALAGYSYLVRTLGIPSSSIIIEGDSNGGNLALALTRYLVGHKTTHGMPPPPGGLLLLSPWCDIGLSHDVPRSKAILKADYDPEPNGMDYSKEAFIGPHGMGAADINPYISPGSLHPSMSISFKGFPKTFICAGGTENLHPQIQVLRQRMTRDIDQRVTYWEGKDEPHDYLLFPWFSPAWGVTMEAISDWV
ncbi:alpha/beta-hydrolase, partial [Marasmius fiardii PR-910]